MAQDALRVDLDKLTEMAGQLDELATTASVMKTTPDELWLGTPTLCLESLRTVLDITSTLLDTALVDAVTERFEETADIFRDSVVQYWDASDDMAAQLAATFVSAAGEWTTGQRP